MKLSTDRRRRLFKKILTRYPPIVAYKCAALYIFIKNPVGVKYPAVLTM